MKERVAARVRFPSGPPMILLRMEGGGGGGGAPARESVEFARIVAFTDGVFAIAITLLVLSLEVPSALPDARLHEYLLESWPQVFAYFLSFAVIGRFWLVHHHFVAVLDDFDAGLMLLNLAFLSLVVLVPFPTELLGEYGGVTDAVVLYAAVVGSAALVSAVMIRYALRRGRVRPRARPAAERAAAGATLAPIVFYLSIPVAFVSPQIAPYLWLALLVDVRRRRR
jgi:uncharacterized membrane protein